MNTDTLKKYLPFLSILILFGSVTYFFYGYTSPDEIVNYIGVDNAYILVFILALIGGLTTFSGIPYHIVVITLAIGGVNPILLGVAAASGVIIGDSTSYYLGYQGAKLAPQHLAGFSEKIRALGERYPRFLPIFFFLFAALTPFSNDFIVITMGIAHYPFWKVMIPLALGNLVFNIGVAYFASSAYIALQAFSLTI